MHHDRGLKKLNFDLLTPSLWSGGGGESVAKIVATMRLHSCFPLVLYATLPCSEKVEF